MLSSNFATFQSWIFIALSICFACSMVAVTIYCICWKAKSKSLQQVYVLDDSGLTKIENKRGTFYRFASVTSFDGFKTEKIQPNPCENNGKFVHWGLQDSLDITQKFDRAVLKLDITSDPKGYNSENDEMLSCISSDSRNTFFSIYPMKRSSSAGDTIRSAFSESDSN